MMKYAMQLVSNKSNATFNISGFADRASELSSSRQEGAFNA